MAKNSKLRAARYLEEKDMRPKAVARYIRISPYKVRTVLDVIRGKSVNEAVAILSAMTNAGCLPVKKAILSAAANAEHNRGMDRTDLVVAACYADQGAVLKRAMPRAKGRSARILKRTSHITVILDAKTK